MIQIAPNELVFNFSPGLPLRAFISVRNRSQNTIAIKIKSTATEEFQVVPNRT